MPTSLEHLLPGPDRAVRCAEHARSIQVDPCGTALRADRIVLVPTPAPWPKPALAHPLLAALAERLAAGPVPTRLLATVPASADGSDPVVVYDRVGGSARERRFALADDPERRLAAVGRLLVPEPDDPTADHPMPIEDRAARLAVLICTQGTHDVCCGSEGTRFAETVDASVGQPGGLPADLQVFRVSHTGGHRFAPTAMTLPDGRMWAGLDAEALAAILQRAGAVGRLVERCRGWWGADTGAAQVAERAVFAEVGWELDRRARTVEAVPAIAGSVSPPKPSVDSDRFLVNVSDDRWHVEVEQGREVPTIACRAPGGLPAKTAREYRVVAVDRVTR